MTWGMTAVAGASLISGKLSSDASKDAVRSQEASALAGIESEEKMFDKQLEIMAPYRESGYQAIEGLQGLVDPTQRASMLGEYYKGPEFKAMSDYANRNIMSNASATGGLRGGNTKVDLAQVSPMLGMNYLDSLQNQYTGLANMGMGAASQGAQGAQYLGSKTSNLLGQQGQAQAANQLAQANIWGNTVGTLGGIAGDYFNNPKPGNTYSDGSLI